jgi:integrase
VHAYQSHCGRYDPKTTDQHLAAIRYAEQVTSGLPFSKYTRETVDGIREDLKASLSGKSEPRLANSTVAHKASQLSAFYSWLIGQDGFDHLPRDLIAYMVLPRSAYAAALPPTKREFPTMAESEQMLEAMPSGTLAEGRDRAIFAVANLGGLRADTVVSLRIGSIDPENALSFRTRASAGLRKARAYGSNGSRLSGYFQKWPSSGSSDS